MADDEQVRVFAIEGFKDHRASRFFDINPELEGQITVSVVAPGQVSGWHYHKLQHDVFFVATGRLKVATIAPDGTPSEFILDGSQSIRIPSYHWHCYRSFEEPCVLVYYLSRKHDESDEYRFTEDEIEDRFGYRM